MAGEQGFTPWLLKAVEERNNAQKHVLFQKTARRFGPGLAGLTFGIWGLAFKPGTDDMREAPSLVLLQALIDAGARVLAHDPVAMEAARRELPSNWFENGNLAFVEDQYEAIRDVDAMVLVTEDTHGHLVGSNTLRQLSRVLEGCVRQVDTVARYGGDEFTILLADTGARLGRTVAERIRQSVERHGFEAGGGRLLRLSCSIDVSTYPAHGRTREALLDGADKAMYRAKSLGRNRVCSADELA